MCGNLEHNGVETEPASGSRLAEHYARALLECHSGYDLFRLLKQMTLDMGFRYFLVVRFPLAGENNLGDLSLLSNLPAELVQAYDQADLLRSSPILEKLQDSTRPVEWEADGINVTRKPEAVEAAERLYADFGIRAGICFSVHDSADRRGAISFSGDRPACSMDEQLFLSWICNQVFERATFFAYEEGTTKPQLSARELECLGWTAAGKTSSEIAVILDLSEHTVNHYLTGCCQKLSAANRAHAVAKGIRLGLI